MQWQLVIIIHHLFYVNGFGGRSSGNPFMHTTNNFSHDTWYHYAVTRSGNTFRMFIDGVLEDTQTSSGSLNIALGGFRSGWSFDGANGYFNGYVQNNSLLLPIFMI